MKYTHLSISERNLIQHFFNDEKLSISEIAKKINRSKSTISRELKRNTF
ncbi:helix-turn-helix domain-containing protein, partial [bacterium]|nr:helix-turn-helix domain-containing protein [bacterium]